MMNFSDAVKSVLTQYFKFSGRARRSEYWWFYLFTILVAIVAGIIDGAIMGWENADSGPVGNMTSLALFIPSLSVGWRRLHDTGRSGWWIGGLFIAIFAFAMIAGIMALGSAGLSSDREFGGLMALIIIGAIGLFIYAIAILVFLCQDSHRDDNKYGPSPKYGSQKSVFD
ncbi:DUF805 domain-containing protein [Litorimonas sp. RW-G-Af-16]|uniref:DUF805 domain-containing protein n=1 Tax=Litorimonas sp. RW-G-Af-16 TaxID=3241168 RepID=UPI00390C949E